MATSEPMTTAVSVIDRSADPSAVAEVSVRRVDSASGLTAVRRLHAQVYLGKGYVEPDDLVDGMLRHRVDPWVEHSTYFAASDATGSLVGVGRQIRPPRVQDLPAFQLERLHTHVTDQLRRQPRGSVVEISALAVAKPSPAGTSTALYSAMWHHAVAEHHEAWVMSIHPGVFRLLTSSLGPVLEPFGPPQWFMGSDVIPAVLWSDTLASTVAAHASTLADRRHAGLLPRLFPCAATRRTA